MRCPTLREIPKPPSDKNGWPWTEEPPTLPDTMTGGRLWPKIGIVTPSYNQGKFIEKTIRSVLLQGYPNLEYIIVDGGSGDNSVEVIKKYADYLTGWTSEKDKGQSHAINKGFSRTKGEILAWLNSDDIFEPNALRIAAENLIQNVNWITGSGVCIYESGETKLYNPDTGITPANWVSRFLIGSTYAVIQSSSFWKREVWDKCGPLSENLHNAFDHEFFLKVLCEMGEPRYINEILSRWLFHRECKTFYLQQNMIKELVRIGMEQSHTLDFTKRLEAPFVAARTLSRLMFYESIGPAGPGGEPSRARLFSVLRKYPILVTDRMLWGFFKREIYKWFKKGL